MRISDWSSDVCSSDLGGTLLTTINALDPIYFTFQGSEALFLKTKREGAQKGADVEVRLQDENDYRWKGRIDFTDNDLHPRPGPLPARGRVDHPEVFRTPSLFGTRHLSTGPPRPPLRTPRH